MVSKHTYYGFKLEDAVRGLKRALRDRDIPIVSICERNNEIVLTIDLASESGDIIMVYHKTTETHPLSKLGDIPMIDVVVDDKFTTDLRPILTMAFLRGGG